MSSLPKPYYDHGGVVLFHGDCRDILPALTADAVVSDPPFGISDKPFEMGVRTSGRRGGDNTWHPESDWDKAIEPEWMPLCLASAPVVAWFGHWKARAQVEAHAGMPARAEIVWAKDMHCGPPCPVARQDERIWLFSKAGIQCKRFDTTVWNEPVIPTWSKKLHKNEKPLRLMRRLVSLLLSPGQKLIDPFMGSGSTVVAAKEMGVLAIGIDKDERHVETAAKRLAQEGAVRMTRRYQPYTGRGWEPRSKEPIGWCAKCDGPRPRQYGRRLCWYCQHPKRKSTRSPDPISRPPLQSSGVSLDGTEKRSPRRASR